MSSKLKITQIGKFTIKRLTTGYKHIGVMRLITNRGGGRLWRNRERS